MTQNDQRAPEPFTVTAFENGSFSLKCRECGAVKSWKGKPPWMEHCESAADTPALTPQDAEWLVGLLEQVHGDPKYCAIGEQIVLTRVILPKLRAIAAVAGPGTGEPNK